MKSSDLQPTILVIFGITGDLAKRYLLPSLYHLFQEHLLPDNFRIVGLTRQNLSVDQLFSQVELCIYEVDNTCDPEAIRVMREHTELDHLDPASQADYDALLKRLNRIESERGECMNRLYYLAIPPHLFATTVDNMGQAGLNQSCQHKKAETRVLVEKPFGSDLISGQELITRTTKVFKEEQVFRIDHYLAKETAQNIITFRSQNPIFASLWNKTHIRSITIRALEAITIEGRVQFYEGVGALRDLIQSHLLQLLAVTTMELPTDITRSDQLHARKQQLLQSVEPADPAQARRAQYDSYRQEVNNPSSTTETFASIKLYINNERWQGVPITITTGKALEKRNTDISVCFDDNILTLRIQPNEGIDLRLRVKKPGFVRETADVVMDFSYARAFHGGFIHPSAYEHVLMDAIKGDHTLFATSEEVLASWRILQPIITAWRDDDRLLETYPSGSTGPA